MATWQQWRKASQESLDSALLSEGSGLLRPSINRYYFAAYQATTACLVYRRLTPPGDRAAWSHESTPDLIAEQLEPLIERRDVRKDLGRRLKRLYDLRISADYQPDEPITTKIVLEAKRDCGYLVRTLFDTLPDRPQEQ
jgi:uncharacterized protein (UPF0332 family)